MRLTKREQTLIIVMLFLVAAYFVFQYIVTPQRAELSDAKETLAEWKIKKQKLDTLDDTLGRLGTRRGELETEMLAIENAYFESLDEQEEAIIVINDIFKNSNLKDTSITFEPLSGMSEAAAEASVAGTDPGVLVQKVEVEFEGSYDSIWTALRKTWGFARFIRVDSISIDSDADNAALLTGTVELSLFDMSQITLTHTNIVEWAESGKFRTPSPFGAPANEPFPGKRYILNVSGNPQGKYIKFIDISGSWAETAIDNFGRLRLITGDKDNRFIPDDAMTRGDLVVLLDKYFKWEVPSDAVDLTKFSDYNELGQSLSAMEAAFYKGFILGCLVGYDDGTLRPNVPTSYKEFELLMSRSLEQPDFKWKDAALMMKQETGFESPGLSDENAGITRAEVVYFLHSLPQE